MRGKILMNVFIEQAPHGACSIVYRLRTKCVGIGSFVIQRTSDQREQRGKKNLLALAQFFLFKFRYEVAREGFTLDELKDEWDGFKVERLLIVLTQQGYVAENGKIYVVTEEGMQMPDPQ
jgi:hypothetical protein